jgi:hypothetical protein
MIIVADPFGGHFDQVKVSKSKTAYQAKVSAGFLQGGTLFNSHNVSKRQFNRQSTPNPHEAT